MGRIALVCSWFVAAASGFISDSVLTPDASKDVAFMAQHVLNDAGKAIRAKEVVKQSAFLQITKPHEASSASETASEAWVLTFLDLYPKKGAAAFPVGTSRFRDLVTKNIHQGISQVMRQYGEAPVKANTLQILDVVQSSSQGQESQPERHFAVKYRFPATLKQAMKLYAQTSDEWQQAFGHAIGAAFAETESAVVAKVRAGTEAFMVRARPPEVQPVFGYATPPVVMTPPMGVPNPQYGDPTYFTATGLQCNPAPKFENRREYLETALYLWQDFNGKENADTLMCNRDFTDSVRNSILSGLLASMEGTFHKGYFARWDEDRIHVRSVELSNTDFRVTRMNDMIPEALDPTLATAQQTTPQTDDTQQQETEQQKTEQQDETEQQKTEQQEEIQTVGADVVQPEKDSALQIQTEHTNLKEPGKSALQMQTGHSSLKEMSVSMAARALSGGALWIGKASENPYPTLLHERLSVTYAIYVDDTAMGQRMSRVLFEGGKRSNFEVGFMSTYGSSTSPYAKDKLIVEQTRIVSGGDPGLEPGGEETWAAEVGNFP